MATAVEESEGFEVTFGAGDDADGEPCRVAEFGLTVLDSTVPITTERVR